MKSIYKGIGAVSVAMALLGLPMTALAREAEPGQWQFAVTPYLWVPTIDGELTYESPPGAGNPRFELGPTDWFDLLNFAAFVGGSAKKGRFSVISDIAYLKMSNEPDSRLANVETVISGPGGVAEIPVGADFTLDTETDLQGLMWSVAFGYELYRADRSYLDAFVGGRYFGVDLETKWSLTTAITSPGGTEIFPADGRISNDTDLWDGIVGARGQFALGDSPWSVPFYADVGSGSSEITWNAFVGLTYEFEWGDLLFAYRHLEYDQDASGLLQNFSFSGPAMGARFNF